MDLAQYIQQRRNMGASDAQIRQELLASGWQPEALDQVFAQLSGASFSSALEPVATQPFTTEPTAGSGLQFHKKLLAVLAVVLVLFVGAVLFWPKASQKVVNKTGQATLQKNQSVVAQKNDILQLAAKITDYQSNNNGSLPATVKVVDTHSLRLCDAQCSVASTATVTLDFDVSGVELHAYSSNLKVPNGQAIYIVPSATCNQTNTAATEVSSTRAFAVLYLAASSGSTQQQCVSN
jgi:hypothetical protein